MSIIHNDLGFHSYSSFEILLFSPYPADTVHAYWPPLPVTVLNFYFLLYRQSASVNITDTTSYSSGPANTLDSDR